ncbi:hypothetical protein K9M42_01560 [Patescibacteria group bacterium]|nr:hypothetical protein [Patescibacteria group bacterium]
MLTTKARDLLDRMESGDKNVHLKDVLNAQRKIKRLPTGNWQCQYCVYRDCIHNITKEEDLPKENTPEGWKLFHKFDGCWGCKDYEKI